MKKLLALIAAVSSLSAMAMNFNFPSATDFERLEKTAVKKATATATEFATERGYEVVLVEKDDSRFLTTDYNVLTDGDCEFTVSVGLGFRTKVSNATSCN